MKAFKCQHPANVFPLSPELWTANRYNLGLYGSRIWLLADGSSRNDLREAVTENFTLQPLHLSRGRCFSHPSTYSCSFFVDVTTDLLLWVSINRGGGQRATVCSSGAWVPYKQLWPFRRISYIPALDLQLQVSHREQFLFMEDQPFSQPFGPGLLTPASIYLYLLWCMSCHPPPGYSLHDIHTCSCQWCSHRSESRVSHCSWHTRRYLERSKSSKCPEARGFRPQI